MSYIKGWHKGVRAALAFLIAGIIVALYPAGVPVAEASERSPEAAKTDILSVPQPQDAGDADSDPEANLPYLFAVFIITWAVFFGYLFVMSRRHREMQREIEGLKETLAARERQVAVSEPSPSSREP